ncbi:AAA family ATPase [Spongiactinospora sp. TRM90649]|uniref:AAA family ATPase n=1 Tax=Spongiactinospora sp. TRM90649 TaxID=3031114 RepID=UPI0023F94C9A|nr:AAA family ATPase [Spongiactinospora sp. TRM90649]MDF5753663.1 AAA family ATPase [Spongiactinospora sp. TRM90649]
MRSDQPRLVVVTGGPGSGKSTLIDLLAAGGHARSAEAGRAIIRDQTAIGGPALPWGDRALFAELMLGWELRSYHAAQETAGPVFFDRGVPDVLAYLRLEGLPVPAHMRRAAERFRYARRVFLAPPWPEIYTTDTERKQTYEVAVQTYESVRATYLEYGYEPVPLPLVPPRERAGFVLRSLPEIVGGDR